MAGGGPRALLSVHFAYVIILTLRSGGNSTCGGLSLSGSKTEGTLKDCHWSLQPRLMPETIQVDGL